MSSTFTGKVRIVVKTKDGKEAVLKYPGSFGSLYRTLEENDHLLAFKGFKNV